MSNYKLIKKASAKTIMGNVKALAKELSNGQTLDLFNIYGTTNDTKTGDGDNGPWVAFIGRFEAENLVSGEVFRSGTCFLPDVAGDLLEQAMKDAEGSIELAFTISIREDENSAVGYVYEAKPLMQPQEDDELARIKSSLVKLEAPKPEEKAPEKPTNKK